MRLNGVIIQLRFFPLLFLHTFTVRASVLLRFAFRYFSAKAISSALVGPHTSFGVTHRVVYIQACTPVCFLSFGWKDWQLSCNTTTICWVYQVPSAVSLTFICIDDAINSANRIDLTCAGTHLATSVTGTFTVANNCHATAGGNAATGVCPSIFTTNWGIYERTSARQILAVVVYNVVASNSIAFFCHTTTCIRLASSITLCNADW